ncbi:MAG TPA: hypothetical protein VFV38_13340, partial [Ktedonobacteraceae bacterium]|nr:hypothetical protein [Ktedonobacteraceae bacterium]
MKQHYTFCEQVQVMIPWPERFKLAGKISLVFAASIGIVYGFVCFYAYLWLQFGHPYSNLLGQLKFGSPVPVFGGFDYAALTGVCIGYIMKYSPAVLRGYKEEKRLPSEPAGAYANCLLPERSQVRVTEEIIEADVSDVETPSPTEVPSDPPINCDILEIRGETPIYGPPEVRRTLVKQMVQILLGFFDRLTICLKRSDGLLK